jgi:hypothetical protein
VLLVGGVKISLALAALGASGGPLGIWKRIRREADGIRPGVAEIQVGQ